MELQKNILLQQRTLDLVQPQVLSTTRAAKSNFIINLMMDIQD